MSSDKQWKTLSPKVQRFRREVKLRRENTVPKKTAKAFFNGYVKMCRK